MAATVLVVYKESAPKIRLQAECDPAQARRVLDACRKASISIAAAVLNSRDHDDEKPHLKAVKGERA